MKQIVEAIIERAIQIQQIPAPTFREHQRAAFLKDHFHAEGLKDIEIDTLGNVYARWPGDGMAGPIIVSAHTDTVFPPDTDLACARKNGKLYGPGIGDNSLGVAGLFGLLWALRRSRKAIPGDLWLVANVREEGLGDLKGMRAVVDRFGDAPLAYIVLEGMSLGKIYHRGLGVQRYHIHAQTQGGHSWADYGAPSAIHELSALITRLTAIPISKRPRASLNVGVVSGGFSVNTIAAEASLELDLRAEKPEPLQKLVQVVEKLVTESNRPGVQFRAKIIGQRPAGEIPPDHPLVKAAVSALQKQGIRPQRSIGSTDANIPLSRGLPAVCIGLTHGGGAHTTREFIEPRPVEQGMAQLLALTQIVYETTRECPFHPSGCGCIRAS